ncbi:MAG: redoxin domain-containing protein [Myxococcales bacterium FL481]|nr:MAG: redoxin domain-containing protein [Myxococcales bacterium FL481]
MTVVEKLRPGVQMPAWTAESLTSKTISSSDISGNMALLTFYRYASCPVCASTLAQYRVRAGEITSRGVELISFFHSPVERMKVYFDPGSIPFEVVCDPEREIYERFRVTSRVSGLFDPRALGGIVRSARYAIQRNPFSVDGSVAMMPADFLFDRDGRLLDSNYGAHVSDGWSVDEALAVIDRFRTARAA